MKKAFIAVIILLIMMSLSACASNSYGPTPPSGDKSSGSGDPSPTSEFTESQNGNVDIAAGQLTAAEWNDNDHYDKWLELFVAEQESATGVYTEFLNKWEFNTINRIVVNVQKEGIAMSGVTVLALKEDTVLYKADTDAKGKAYLFLKNVQEEDSLRIVVVTNEDLEEHIITYTKDMPQVDIELTDAKLKVNKLEIMFVVDTTGSMGDELNYLKSEIKDVITQVKQSNPETDISVALLFYRDDGDEYATRYFDFNADIDAVKADISAQSAGGGGDYPEAVHTALSQAVAKQWSSTNSTKLIIHILDAPPHDQPQIMDTYADSIYSAADKGIRMIPIASSGVDRGTEYLLRNEALLTGGTYIFITDESGIGNSHLEPTIEDFVVEYLNALLVRVINEFHTGIHLPPIPYDQQ